MEKVGKFKVYFTNKKKISNFVKGQHMQIDLVVEYIISWTAKITTKKSLFSWKSDPYVFVVNFMGLKHSDPNTNIKKFLISNNYNLSKFPTKTDI